MAALGEPLTCELVHNLTMVHTSSALGSCLSIQGAVIGVTGHVARNCWLTAGLWRTDLWCKELVWKSSVTTPCHVHECTPAHKSGPRPAAPITYASTLVSMPSMPKGRLHGGLQLSRTPGSMMFVVRRSPEERRCCSTRS